MGNREINTITPYEKNAKKHPTKQVDQIAASIQEFGFNQPIVVDKQGVIIVGHGRYEAAKKLGMEKVPVLEVDLTREQADAYRLADNKLNESDWDMKLVIDELKELDQKGYDISITGFDRDLILEDDIDDDVVPEVEPTSKLGDIYRLGEHYIMCGDSTNKEHYQQLMQGRTADMVFTDPPYNVDYKGSGKNTQNGILNDKMDDDSFREFLDDVFSQIKDSTKKGAGCYIFHSHKTMDTFMNSLEDTGFIVDTQLIWNKPSAGLGMNDYRTKHEPFFYCYLDKDHVFYGDRTNTTVIDFQKDEQDLLEWAKKQKIAEQEGKTTIWTVKRSNVNEYVHPTQKPVQLIEYAIKNSSKSGDIVLDPFLGSGSTVIACEKMGRICYGMDLDPKYVDTVVKRWEDYTGQVAGKVV